MATGEVLTYCEDGQWFVLIEGEEEPQSSHEPGTRPFRLATSWRWESATTSSSRTRRAATRCRRIFAPSPEAKLPWFGENAAFEPCAQPEESRSKKAASVITGTP